MAPPEKVEIDSQNRKLYKGESTLLRVFLTPQNAFFNELIWETTDATIATVSQLGEVTAINPGIAEITVSSTKNPEVKATCSIKVCEHTTGVSMPLTEKMINIGEAAILSANTLPIGTSDNEVTWSTSDNKVAVVDAHGKVEARALGNCVITATTVDGGYTVECKITVVQPAKTVTLNKSDASIFINNSEMLKVSVSPENTTDKTVLWSSSDTIVATVDSIGTVTAKKAGKAIITATAASNPDAKATCEVTVIQPVESITLNEISLIIEQFGEMVKLTATILPEDASNKSIKWTSSNPAVCTVTGNGTVIAVGNGTATVIATTEDGDIPATCVVNVKDYIYDTNRDGAIDVADIATIIEAMARGQKSKSARKE